MIIWRGQGWKHKSSWVTCADLSLWPIWSERPLQEEVQGPPHEIEHVGVSTVSFLQTSWKKVPSWDCTILKSRFLYEFGWLKHLQKKNYYKKNEHDCDLRYCHSECHCHLNCHINNCKCSEEQLQIIIAWIIVSEPFNDTSIARLSSAIINRPANQSIRYWFSPFPHLYLGISSNDDHNYTKSWLKLWHATILILYQTSTVLQTYKMQKRNDNFIY